MIEDKGITFDYIKGQCLLLLEYSSLTSKKLYDGLITAKNFPVDVMFSSKDSGRLG